MTYLICQNRVVIHTNNLAVNCQSPTFYELSIAMKSIMFLPRKSFGSSALFFFSFLQYILFKFITVATKIPLLQRITILVTLTIFVFL